MDDYKRVFIEFALKNGLKVFDNPDDDRTLKSGRISPWFMNLGDFNDGCTLANLSESYADAIISSGVRVDSLFGIPEKGVSLVGPVATDMARRGMNVGWFFTRKEVKTHGEATGKTDLTKKVVGRIPRDGESIGQLDDVFTAGDAKYGARKELESMGMFTYPLLAIALDRQEVAIDGRNAIEEYQKNTDTRVVSVVSASDVLEFLRADSKYKEAVRRMENYLRVYGTDEVKGNIGKLEQTVITRDRSVIPACDISSLDRFEELVKNTADIDGIGGYKIGFELGLFHGLPKVVEVARKYTKKPIIYDHQKAGTDIPDTGRNFANVMKNAGVDTVILFPQSGPETERAWIYHALDKELNVIVGGRMTHPAYAVSEGGFISDEGALSMYRIAARAGVRHFVVPGNKIDVIKQVRELVESEGISNPVFYAPGFVAQKGEISEAARVAGDRFHGIVGRGIYATDNIRQAAVELTSKL